MGYVKNGEIRWKEKGWRVKGGLMSRTEFKVEEDLWGKGYVMKCLEDEYKLGRSGELGV